jgi:(p)ppGpp synthase/HD superfamily hydrolase
MSTLQRAIEIATKAHAGQVDKAGKAYIGHPLRVMEMGKSEDEKIIGVLHDVIEDTPLTIDDIAKEGFSTEIIDALQCVTKLHNETYAHFISRVLTNTLAIKVKINDLKDNMDITRLSKITDKDLERIRKYQRAYNRLMNYLNE